MTPLEKAATLIDKFYFADEGMDLKDGIMNGELAKRCALIAVDELLKESDSYKIIEYLNTTGMLKIANQVEYWQEVKQEIEKH